MTEIEKIRRYIDRTGKKYPNGTPYQMNIGEMLALAHLTREDAAGAICLAFDYGKAKGERSARAAQKREAAV